VAWLLLLLFQAGAVAAEDAVQATSDETDTFILAFCLLLGALTSALLGTGLFAFSLAEARILNRYNSDGVQVRALVTSAEFTRLARQPVGPSCSLCRNRCSLSTPTGGGDNDGEDGGEGHADGSLDQEEYEAIVDYRLPEAFGQATPEETSAEQAAVEDREVYSRLDSKESPPQNRSGSSGCSIAVRKQVTVRGSDFVSPSGSCCGADQARPVQVDFASHDACLVPASSPRGSASLLLHVDVLVVPGYKRSALPARQVRRMLRWSHRAPSLIVVTGLFALSVGGAILGIRTAASVPGASIHSPTSLSCAAVAASLLLSGSVAYLCLSPCIERALASEYLEGDHDALHPPPLGDSYSIESGDDAYLAM
jgi:hypothetical protein